MSQGSLSELLISAEDSLELAFAANSMLLAISYPMSSTFISKFTDPVSLMVEAEAARASRKMDTVNLIFLEFVFIKI